MSTQSKLQDWVDAIKWWQSLPRERRVVLKSYNNLGSTATVVKYWLENVKGKK